MASTLRISMVRSSPTAEEKLAHAHVPQGRCPVEWGIAGVHVIRRFRRYACLDSTSQREQSTRALQRRIGPRARQSRTDQCIVALPGTHHPIVQHSTSTHATGATEACLVPCLLSQQILPTTTPFPNLSFTTEFTALQALELWWKASGCNTFVSRVILWRCSGRRESEERG